MKITCSLCCVLHALILCAQFSDDFEDFAGLQHWHIFQPGDSLYYQSLVYDDSLLDGQALSNTQGKLVMTSGPTYWYADVTGPFVYQQTWGDFTATTSVRSLDRDNINMPPQSEFNSTGLLIRNPDTAYGQNYIMVNLGMQSIANHIGSESKTTMGSVSTLFLDPDLHEGEVRMSRTGTVIRTYKRTGSDMAFVLLDEFDRPDIPDTVQIGLVLNGYTSDPDIRGEFEWISFAGGNCRLVRHDGNDGVNSLREAIACAESGDTILFDHVILSDTVIITSGPLIIDKDLVIYASEDVVIHGVGLPSLFEIAPGTTFSMTGCTLLVSEHQGPTILRNAGTLYLTDCTMAGHQEVIPLVDNLGTMIINGSVYMR